MLFTSEQVSRGHPDKICDQIADAVVTDCLQHDRDSRVAVECMIKGSDVYISGEITSKHDPDFEALVQMTLWMIGYGEDSRSFTVHPHITRQSPDIALGVDKQGAGDQGIIFGYATSETQELLPLPFVLATEALEALADLRSPILLPDAKSQVTYDYRRNRIDTFLISTQHQEDASLDEVRHTVESIMKKAARRYGQNEDFKVLVNPTGRFVLGGSFADTGVTGRKLACDTYGGVGHIGGGAMSGKDPSKVDRSGTYMARKIARDIVLAGYADRCEVQIAYAIGVAEPVSVNVETFGTEHEDQRVIEGYVRDSYDLTPRGIIESLGLLDVNYNQVSAYGHFGRSGLPWEEVVGTDSGKTEQSKGKIKAKGNANTQPTDQKAVCV